MLALKDLDHVAARVHGRRGRLYDGARLRALCALGSAAELARTLFPGDKISAPARLEERLAAVFIAETRELAACFGGARAGLLEWQAARFQLGNIKTLVRAIAAGAGPEETRGLLVDLPAGMEGYGKDLAAVKSREDLAAALPDGLFRDSLSWAFADYPGKDAVFFVEAALERDYLAELSARAEGLGAADRESAGVLYELETAAFNQVLALRGKFLYGFPNKELLRLYAPCSARELRIFKAILAAADLGSALALAYGLEGGVAPGLAGLEALSRRRYRHAALKALRGDHLGFGAVAAYLALRRLETADLITLAQGLRLGVSAAELEKRLLPGLEAAHV